MGVRNGFGGELGKLGGDNRGMVEEGGTLEGCGYG